VAKITGNNTDETFTAQNGVSYNGQGGFDTLVFSGTYASYDIELKDTGNIKTDVSWSSGALDTKWIERFVFSDGVYNVTTDTFTANPPPPTPTLSIADAAVNEEAGTITFTVTLSFAAATPVTFTYSTADGTAGSADYVGVTNQAGTIAAGQTSTTITIALINDNIVETGGETFFVNLSNPVGATIADSQAVGTILEQDQLIVGTAGDDDAVDGIAHRLRHSHLQAARCERSAGGRLPGHFGQRELSGGEPGDDGKHHCDAARKTVHPNSRSDPHHQFEHAGFDEHHPSVRPR
jgi:hypothetical protein